VGLGPQAVDGPGHREQMRQEPADVGRHPDQEVRQRDRRARRVRFPSVRVPFAPEQRIGRLDFFAEPLVQRSEPIGIVQVCKGISSDAKGGSQEAHLSLRRYTTSRWSRHYASTGANGE